MKSPIRMILFSFVYIFFTGMFFYHLFFTRYVDILVDEKVYLIEDRYPMPVIKYSEIEPNVKTHVKVKNGLKKFCFTDAQSLVTIYDCFEIMIEPFWKSKKRYVINKSIIVYE